MAETHVMSALKAKRDELARFIDTLQDQLCERMIELDHVDSTLRIFDADIDLDEIRRRPLPPRHRVFKGQVTRPILDILRQYGPMDAQTITRRIMTDRELNIGDKALVSAMHKRIGAALRNGRGRGLVTSKTSDKGMLVWEVAG
jgi:hypothetical protein